MPLDSIRSSCFPGPCHCGYDWPHPTPTPGHSAFATLLSAFHSPAPTGPSGQLSASSGPCHAMCWSSHFLGALVLRHPAFVTPHPSSERRRISIFGAPLASPLPIIMPGPTPSSTAGVLFLGVLLAHQSPSPTASISRFLFWPPSSSCCCYCSFLAAFSSLVASLPRLGGHGTPMRPWLLVFLLLLRSGFPCTAPTHLLSPVPPPSPSGPFVLRPPPPALCTAPCLCRLSWITYLASNITSTHFPIVPLVPSIRCLSPLYSHLWAGPDPIAWLTSASAHCASPGFTICPNSRSHLDLIPLHATITFPFPPLTVFPPVPLSIRHLLGFFRASWYRSYFPSRSRRFASRLGHFPVVLS